MSAIWRRCVAKRPAKSSAAGGPPCALHRSDVERHSDPLAIYGLAKEQEDRVGLAHGLAYTEFGGDILSFEVTVVPGKGQLTLTGKLGEVMRESAQAGFSYIRSRARQLGLAPMFHEKVDIHMHVPEGATPKDGPSAGITIAVALASALTGRAVRHDVAMTGEITLRGRVLPSAALRKKYSRPIGWRDIIIIPRENAKDLEDIPANIRRQLDIRLVEHMDEVLELALAALAEIVGVLHDEAAATVDSHITTSSDGGFDSDSGSDPESDNEPDADPEVETDIEPTAGPERPGDAGGLARRRAERPPSDRRAAQSSRPTARTDGRPTPSTGTGGRAIGRHELMVAHVCDRPEAPRKV